MNLADDRVARDAVAERGGDLARALSVKPQLAQEFDLFVRPIHVGLVSPTLGIALCRPFTLAFAPETESGAPARSAAPSNAPHFTLSRKSAARHLVADR